LAAAEAPGLAGNSADRTRDVRTITTVVTEVLSANPETTPLDIETALRAAAAGEAYLVANSTT
jgi:3-hydroxy-3-methylglutaryl CoA synthase